MLASIPDAQPSLVNPAFVYEPKYDGIRAIVEVIPGSGARFWSRNGNEKTAQFPDVREAVETWAAKIRVPLVLDGEIVALDADLKPAGFQRLQSRINISVPGYRSKKPILPPDQQPAALIVFDLLREGDDDLRAKPLGDRRARLEALFKKHPSKSISLRMTEQAAGDGKALLARAQAEDWEGLVVKSARSLYRAGKRTPEWIKFKLHKQDKFVIGGWTAPRGTRVGFGALILGLKQPDGLRYVGDVGTGFNGAEIDRVMNLMQRI